MTIGIDIRTLMDSYYSGVSEYTKQLLEEIFKLDKQNDYKLFYNSYHDASKRIPNFIGNNIKVINTRYPNKIFNNVMQKVLHIPKIDKFLEVDLFFVPNIGFIALSSQCRKIITIHDLSFLRYPEFFSLKRRLWHRIINIPKLLTKFDKIVAVSENTKNDMVELCGINPTKITVVYSGINKQFRVIHDSDDVEIKKLLSLETKYNLSKKFILFLGTLEPRKNIEGVIAAYNLFCQRNKNNYYDLVIAGMKGWKASGIFSAWQTSRYKNKIKFIGYVDDKLKVYLYNLASVFIYPSFYEGFGFPPLEAMACGVPVITSFVSSLPEVASEAAVMVNPYDIEDISRAMTEVLKSENLRTKLIAKGLERARMYNWEYTARDHLRIFQN